jgi:hypothetical protein
MKARGQITFSLFLFPFVFFFLSGCRNCDLVEAELRSRDTDLREARADLARAEAQNEALVRELTSVRHGAATTISPELASQTYTLKQITLGRGTGGLDEDNCPGDEALQVVLEPRDGDGHTIKAPGSLHVEALEISPEGLKTAFSSWDLTADQVRHTWHSGLLSTGYFIILPWKNWPSSQKLRIIAQFTLLDGRLFEADKDVTIRLTPLAGRKTSPLLDPGNPTAPIDTGPTLPPPRKLESKPTSTSKSWWLPAAAGADVAGTQDLNSVQPAAVWRPKPPPPLADSVELLRPTQLKYQPGEDQ